MLRFVGIVDDAGKRTAAAASAFSKHDANEFEQAFAAMVKSAYAGLFEIHGNEAWSLHPDKLIHSFAVPTRPATSSEEGKQLPSRPWPVLLVPNLPVR